MEMKDLQPILTLISESEERLATKINEVHEDVTETKNQVTNINGRLRKAEIDIGKIESTCSIRTGLVDKAMDDIRPIRNTGRFMKWAGKHPGFTGFIILSIIVAIQTLVLIAIDKDWISQIWEKITGIS